MENVGCISIYKHFTYFIIYPDDGDHRFNFYKDVSFQEEITEIVHIKYANTYRMNFSFYDELVSYLNSAYSKNKPILKYRKLSSDRYDIVYDADEWYGNIFKLIKNLKFKYGVNYQITHEIFPMIKARRTNCNPIEERYVNFLIQKYCIREARDMMSKSLQKVTAKRITNLLFNNPHILETKHLKLQLWEYRMLIGLDLDSNHVDRIDYLRIIFNILGKLGIKCEISGRWLKFPKTSKKSIEMYHKGYQYVPQQPGDEYLFEEELIQKYKLKKLKYNYLNLFKSKEF